MNPEAILELAKKQRARANDYWKENWEKARDDIKFKRGDHWPEKYKLSRELDGRPCLVINRLPAFLRQVVGDQRQNRPQNKVRPVDDAADPKTAEVIEGLMRNIEYISRGKTVQDVAFSGSTGNGFGYIRIVTEYSGKDSFTQDIKYKRVFNPFSVVLDDTATEADHSDGMFAFVDEWISREEFKARYPGQPMISVDSPEAGPYPWFRDDDVLIAEYYRRVPIKSTIGLTSKNEVVDMDEVKDRIIENERGKFLVDPELPPSESPPVQIVQTREAEYHKVERYLLSGAAVLEGPDEFPSQWIPIVPVWGEEVCTEHGKKELNSVIRFGKDPARLYNYFRSAAAEVVALAPKAPFILTAKQVENHEAMWEEANRKNSPYLVYNFDRNAPPPQRQSPPQASSAILEETKAAEHDQKATIGIFDPALGARSNETSGKAIIARQKESDVSTFVWMDNLTIAMQHAGRIILELIPIIYDTERVIRIRGKNDKDDYVQINKEYQTTPSKEGEAVETLMHDLTVGKYDVQVETGPSYSTQRIEAASSMMEFIQALPQTAEIIADLVAKNMDWPGASEIAARLRKALPPGVVELEEGEQPPQPPEPTPEQELENRKLELEDKKIEVEFEKLKVEVAKIQAEERLTPDEVKELVIKLLSEQGGQG